uniref:Uncharacterized protein n=1 Tax=Megaselia scalaris TaxID=36166 RepID=T1GFW7_MEGSC
MSGGFNVTDVATKICSKRFSWAGHVYQKAKMETRKIILKRKSNNNLTEAASEYCRNTTIHGIKYIGAKELP